MLLGPVDIGFAHGPGAPGAAHGDFKGVGRIKGDDIEHLVGVQPLQFGDAGFGERRHGFETLVGVGVAKDNVNREQERPGVFAGDELG